MQHQYVTDRLVLEVLGPEDASLVLDYYRRNCQFLGPWEPVREASFYTLQCQEAMLEMEAKKIKSGDSARLWLIKQDEYKKRVIGNFGFANIVRGVFQSCHLGYKLDKDETGHGYMTEALTQGIQIAFQDMNLHRIEANIIPRNHASRQLVNRLGFYEEGLAPKYLQINGIWEDHIHYSLISKCYKDQA